MLAVERDVKHSYGHVGMLAVERDVTNKEFLFTIKSKSTPVYVEGFSLTCDKALKANQSD